MISVPAKIRVLDRVRRIFPEWAIRRQAGVIERAFASDLKKAKNNHVERENIISQLQFEVSEYTDALSSRRSARLIKKAQRLYIPFDDLEWVSGNFGHRYLDGKSESRLSKIVLEESRKALEFRLKIAGGIISLLTGLVGAIIGLVAVLKK
jgi:hypothetical protein